MFVKDLIKYLQAFDSELEVVIQTPDEDANFLDVDSVKADAYYNPDDDQGEDNDILCVALVGVPS